MLTLLSNKRKTSQQAMCMTSRFVNYTSLALIAVLWSQSANALVYKGTDSNGIPIFTDKPEKHADKSLTNIGTDNPNPVNFYDPNGKRSGQNNYQQKTQSRVTRNNSESEIADERAINERHLPQQEQAINYQINILSPKQDDTVYKPANLIINAQITPTMNPNHSIQVFVDNQLVGNSANTSASTDSLYRGNHIVKIVVIDSNKQILSQASQSFFLFQHSILFKKKKPKVKKDKVDISSLKP